LIIFIFGYCLITVTDIFAQFAKLDILQQSELLNQSHLNLYQPVQDYLIQYKILSSHITESNLIDYKNIFAQQITQTEKSSSDFRNNNSYEPKSFFTIFKTLRSDLTNFYLSGDNLFCFGLSLMFHAVVANTSIDHDLRNWYQDEIRSSWTNDLARQSKYFGDGQMWIPAFGIAASVYYIGQRFSKPSRIFEVVGNYSLRVLRSYAVGTPTLMLFQPLLGCSRPGDKSYNSAWRFFRANNSLSGHAFIGATPFLVAASMTNQYWLRFILFVCSTLTGLSRINDDDHYFSQVALGWCVSYLSVRAVAKTNKTLAHNNSNIKLFPIIDAQYIGLGLLFRR
jgi:membrane-associated phospholipid phosphatase